MFTDVYRTITVGSILALVEGWEPGRYIRGRAQINGVVPKNHNILDCLFAGLSLKRKKKQNNRLWQYWDLNGSVGLYLCAQIGSCIKNSLYRSEWTDAPAEEPPIDAGRSASTNPRVQASSAAINTSADARRNLGDERAAAALHQQPA